MLIQIRGTGGSGKTTVMNQVMRELSPWKEECIGGNSEGSTAKGRPLYYRNPDSVVVLGPYHTQCGGCDFIRKPGGGSGGVPTLFNVIQSIKFRHMICEGLLLSEDVKWSSQLKDLRVVYLTTPIARCLSQIKSRREEAGNYKPLNPDNTKNRVYVIERSRVKLKGLGVPTYRCSSEVAPKLILSWLRLHAESGG